MSWLVTNTNFANDKEDLKLDAKTNLSLLSSCTPNGFSDFLFAPRRDTNGDIFTFDQESNVDHKNFPHSSVVRNYQYQI